MAKPLIPLALLLAALLLIPGCGDDDTPSPQDAAQADAEAPPEDSMPPQQDLPPEPQDRPLTDMAPDLAADLAPDDLTPVSECGEPDGPSDIQADLAADALTDMPADRSPDLAAQDLSLEGGTVDGPPDLADDLAPDSQADISPDMAIDLGPWPDATMPEPLAEICDDRQAIDTAEPLSLAYFNPNFNMTVYDELEAGDVEASHFIPLAPMRIEGIELYFYGAGDAEIHVWPDLGRSEPDRDIDLITPVTIPVNAGPGWYRVDLSQTPLIIPPNQHFWVGYVHTGWYPNLAMDNSSASGPDHSMFRSQKMIEEYQAQGQAFTWTGLDTEYRIRVNGWSFCPLEEPWFSDRTEEAGLAEFKDMRVAWGDVDGDLYDDLLLHSANGPTYGARLMHNNGDGTFTDITAQSGLAGLGDALGVFGDVDNDGDLDLYLGVYTDQAQPDPGTRDAIYLNDGQGVFTILPGAGVEETGTTSGAAFADFDRDGYIDLYVGNWLVEYPYAESMPDYLFHNNGDGTFTDVSEASGIRDAWPGPCYGVMWGDYDNDGDQDILVSNYGWEPNFLWQNQGDGTFIDMGPYTGVDQEGPSGTFGGNTFGADMADVDNDGDLDIYLSEIAHPRYLPDTDISRLMINDGPPNFTFHDERAQRGIAYDEGEIEPSFIDFDNDGDLDLFISSLYPLHYARLYRQENDGSFTDVTYLAGINVHDATNHAWADVDRDGDLDLVISNRDSAARDAYYRNDVGHLNHWMTIRLTGDDCNRAAIGARVTIHTAMGQQMREVQGGKGHFNSQPSLAVEFGLGPDVDHGDIEVRWPCGLIETFADVEADRFLHITERAGLEVDP